MPKFGEPIAFLEDQDRACGWLLFSNLPQGKTVRVLQSQTVIHQEQVLEPKARDPRLRHGSGANSPLPELSRSGYARPMPVVVLQDGTVGTVMVPKQT